MIVPQVYEKTPQGERAFDIYSRLLQDRIVLLSSYIDDNLSNLVVAQLLFLEAEDPDKDIYLYINSPGGYVHSGLAIFDTMNFVPCDVATYCIGSAASMSAVLLSAGTKGKRYILPNARVLIHQPAGGMEGTASDIKIHAEEMLKTRDRLNEILAGTTGQPLEKIEKDVDRDYFMSAQEAKDYGIVDEVLTNFKE